MLYTCFQHAVCMIPGRYTQQVYITKRETHFLHSDIATHSSLRAGIPVLAATVETSDPMVLAYKLIPYFLNT